MNTSTVNPNVVWICGTAILAGILAGLFILVWHGSIPGTALLGVVATIVAFVTGSLGVHASVNAVTKAMTTRALLAPPPESPATPPS